MQMTIIQKDIDFSTGYRLKETITEIPIEAETENKLFAVFFREYENRYKYCNDLHFSIKEPDKHQAYVKWISDVHNYANNGGDMW